ncbi:MAG: hypothetical protein OXG36_13590 [Caldilineaceae bacterium]|nr:hypothetical protein [Caldilineaceae bacterium]
MSRIDQAKPGRRDGGYARIFADPDIGALISRVHATSIRAGTELEHIIQREAEANGTAITDLDKFLQYSGEGVFIADKKKIKKSKRINFPAAEPDYLIFQRTHTTPHCYVLELKDGDTFDTKKASGEISTLTSFSVNVGSTLAYATSIRVCSFNQEDKQAIVEGFKGAVTIDQVWTGREFCALMGFEFDTIVSERLADAQINQTFLAQQLLNIPKMRTIIIELLESS